MLFSEARTAQLHRKSVDNDQETDTKNRSISSADIEKGASNCWFLLVFVNHGCPRSEGRRQIFLQLCRQAAARTSSRFGKSPPCLGLSPMPEVGSKSDMEQVLLQF